MSVVSRWPDLLDDEEIAELTAEELEEYAAYLQAELERETSGIAELEADPFAWLRHMFPDHVRAPFAQHHQDYWRWLWSIELDVKPDPDADVEVWSRGGAKSESAELGVVALGARRRRRYVLYVCDTQDQADDHVANIGALLESKSVSDHYPALGERRLGKYGNSRGWRRNRLVTASGLVVDALGLDRSARGVKFEDDRPDLIVFDDLDGEDDTAVTTEAKIERITKKLLPAGAPSLAVLAIQNLVHPDSVFAQLVDGRAEFLANRRVSGPIPAVRGLVTEQQHQPDGSSRWVIVAGEPTWEGQSLEVCQSQIDLWGITAFLTEAQHEVTAKPGGMYDHVAFTHCEPHEVPDLIDTVVWVDPAVTDTDQSDSHACQCDGVSAEGVIYRLASWEGRTSPEDSLRRAIRMALKYGCRKVGVETDQGGDTWTSVYRAACEQVSIEDNVPLNLMPLFASDKASKQRQGRGHGAPSKAARNSQMLADYERPGRIVHVLGDGVDALERALRRFPRTKPFDLADAAFWSWLDLVRLGPVRTGTHTLTGSRLPSTSGSAHMGRRQSSPLLRNLGR